MNSNERDEFNALLRQLCFAMRSLPHPELLDGYWKTLEKISLLQFSRCVDYMLSDQYTETKLPPAKAIWNIWRAVQAKTRAPTQQRPLEPAPKESKWLGMLNGRLLRYMDRRRRVEKFKGDLMMVERRAAVRELATYLENLALEECPADPADVDRMFDDAMRRCPEIDPPADHAQA